jgi:regulatory protein
MPLITALEKQKRRPRFDLYLEGVFAFTLRPELILASGLTVGKELTSERQRWLYDEEQRLGAIEAALRLLAMLPRSEQELRDRLQKRGFRRKAVDAAVTRVQEMGYLDDAAYAKFFVETRQASTPRSRRALTFELGRKGVDRELAASSVEEVSDADAAMAAAQRRLRSFSKLDRPTFTRRLGSFLSSRGFGYSVTRMTIERCWAQCHDEDESCDEEDVAPAVDDF